MLTINSIKPNNIHRFNKLNTKTAPNFKGNSENFPPENLFYDMEYGYDKDYDWADKIGKLILKISNLIKNGEDFDTILNIVETNIGEIYNNDEYGKREDCAERSFPIRYDERGCEYLKKYCKKFNKGGNEYYEVGFKSNDEYKDANKAIIYSTSPYLWANVVFWRCKTSNLEYVKKEFEKLQSIKNPTLNEINRACATIKWLISQETPYSQGSDSIGNILTNAIYLAHNVKTYPVKPSTGLDFEAWGCDLEEYIELYPNLFIKAPHFKSDKN